MEKNRAHKKNLYFGRWPGGLKTIAGGARTEIKLNRPWQKTWGEEDRKGCPFCNFSEEDGVKILAKGWRIKTNKFPVYAVNRLLFPDTCWRDANLFSLGGQTSIGEALTAAREEMRAYRGVPIVVSANIGPLAGQNYPHLHYHIQSIFGKKHTSRVQGEIKRLYRERPDLILFDGGITVGIGGVRAGQCFLFPKEEDTGGDDILHHLAVSLHRLISLCNKKFRSRQGWGPDFTIALYFSGGFSYGLYTPILNQWGGSEYLTMYENGHFQLRWPHEVGAAYLTHGDADNAS
jgi:diadenosine tetraphosphate (Ap4A) HIT family hydrolase